MRKPRASAPVSPFSIPRFVSIEVCNSALEVLRVDRVAGTFTAKVYDPLDLTDSAHGDVETFSLDIDWIPVDLAPVLFKAV